MMYSPLVERIIDHVYRRHSNHGVKSKTRTQPHTPPERVTKFREEKYIVHTIHSIQAGLFCCAVAAPVATTLASTYVICDCERMTFENLLQQCENSSRKRVLQYALISSEERFPRTIKPTERWFNDSTHISRQDLLKTVDIEGEKNVFKLTKALYLMTFDGIKKSHSGDKDLKCSGDSSIIQGINGVLINEMHFASFSTWQSLPKLDG
uniref:Uncharacterized protein n=1 Tax=Glossina pallidipes TaxID=7398 RepID=A0A1A9ZTD7_GLOPL